MSKTKIRVWALVLLCIDIAVAMMEYKVLRSEWFSSGTRLFRYYTQNSNVWAFYAASACAVGDLVSLGRGRAIPGWLRALRYVSVCCLMVTLIVPVTVLVPSGTSGSLRSFMLEGRLLYLHTLCPLAMLLGWFVAWGKAVWRKACAAGCRSDGALRSDHACDEYPARVYRPVFLL